MTAAKRGVVSRATPLTHDEVLSAARALVATASPENLLGSWKKIAAEVLRQTGHPYSPSRVRSAFRASAWWDPQGFLGLSDKRALLRAVCTTLIEGEAFSRTAGVTRDLLVGLLEDPDASWPDSVVRTAETIFNTAWSVGDPASASAAGFRLRLMLTGTAQDSETRALLQRRVDRDVVEIRRTLDALFEKFDRQPRVDIVDVIATLTAIEDGFLVQATATERPQGDRAWARVFADAVVAYLTAVTIPAP